MSEHFKNNKKIGFRLCIHLQKKNIPTFYTSHFIIFWCIKPELYNTLLSQIVKNIKKTLKLKSLELKKITKKIQQIWVS
jgi:hypothetical protein